MDYDAELLFPINKTGRDANIRNMFRQGKVIERICNKTGIFCRVQWLDKQNLISRPLPVKQQGSRSTSAVYCPKIGDDVNVTMLPNSDGGEGFIDGSFYNTSNPPPITDPDTRHITFADGTVMEYQEANGTTRSAGQLRIQSAQPINIVSGQVTITADVTINGTLIVDGIVINTHKHTEVTRGGDITGPPTN